MSKSKSRRPQSVTTETPVLEGEVLPHNVVADIAEANGQPEPIPAEAVPPATETPAEVVAEVPVVEVVPLHPILAIAAAAAVAPEGKQKRYPRVGGACWKVWNACDELVSAGSHPTVKDLRNIAELNGWNTSNASQEFYAWRKFHGRK
jgi:hypothetical protein